MPKKTEEVIEDQPICRDPVVSKALSHAVQMCEHILTECGDDPEVLENSHVTVGADFLMDLMEIVIEFALRYEGEDFEGIHDELIMMYEQQAKRKAGFGSKTIH